MGLFGFGGGLKVACSQCDKKIKGAGVTRRQLPFCSQACEAAFIAQHPIAPARGGTPESNRMEAINRLIAGVGELYAAANAAPRLGTSFRVGTSTVTLSLGSSSPHSFNPSNDDGSAARDALYRFDSLALEALPFLYAAGRTAEAERLERLNLGPIRDGLPMSRGSIGSVAHDMHQLLVGLSD
ncbi:MAG TPA: hypothetical protein VGF94_21360 [Kofleriaceae bacterium]|jgi:hypothetical protein